MKLIIIHGDNIFESYQRLQELISVAKKRKWEIKRVSPDSQSLPEEIVGRGLFEEDRLIVFEDIGKIRQRDIDWLKKNKSRLSANLIIYHQAFIPKAVLSSLDCDKVEEFKLPKLIWIFMDTLSPGNALASLSLLHKIVKNQPVELVFALLARHLRDLFWVKEGGELPFPAWRASKLKRQASKFSMELLKNLINDMAEADIRVKTSKEQLLDSLDFIIATRLE